MLHAFDYLDTEDTSYPPICVLFGDERFLKCLVLKKLREVKADHVSSYDSKSVVWRDIRDELSTKSLFGGGDRIIIVNDADEFVKKNRTELEDFAAGQSHGQLMLDVVSFPGNTRLYKQVEKSGLSIECRNPQRKRALDTDRMCTWIATRAKHVHRVSLENGVMERLLDIVGTDLGLLDQEISRLALYTEVGGSVSLEMVRRRGGGWRTKTTWDLMDAALNGNPSEALQQLDRLLLTGEHPQALFGIVSWSLRRFATAARIVEENERLGQRASLKTVLEQAGFRKWPKEALDDAERQLRRLGRKRAGKLYSRLLRADMELKGSHSDPYRARLLLERLFVQLAANVD